MKGAEYYSLLLMNLPCAFFSVDRDGRISEVNSELERMVGWSAADLLARPAEDLLDMMELDSASLAQRTAEGHPYVRTSLRHASGGSVPILLGLAPLEREGERGGILAIALGLTQLESSRPGPLFDPLDSLDKLKADFIAIASHELRTPLAIIKGYVDAFLGGELGELDEFQASRLAIVDGRVDQMTDIINDLLDLGRISEQRLVGERRLTSIGDLVRSEVESLHVEAEGKGLVFSCRISSGLPDISVDGERIRQALENLLDNAIKFTPEGGRIDVSVGIAPGGGALDISVQDSGPGIPADQLEQIFTMFYQVDATSTRRAGGLGLGLFIARGVARAHGGDVRMESEYGRGANCTMRIPLHPEGRA